jgi:hypothetical protein
LAAGRTIGEYDLEENSGLTVPIAAERRSNAQDWLRQSGCGVGNSSEELRLLCEGPRNIHNAIIPRFEQVCRSRPLVSASFASSAGPHFSCGVMMIRSLPFLPWLARG